MTEREEIKKIHKNQGKATQELMDECKAIAINHGYTDGEASLLAGLAVIQICYDLAGDENDLS